ncbi:unnamed protein product [Prunus armeniaca]|uniref:Uncharacterized protein n=1 Tax=Prunus armeniaca TaxID=36596 RepID=A0A6J5XZE4_PRUAR|nr:unnamed protein product [Prunus armeniaca]
MICNCELIKLYSPFPLTLRGPNKSPFLGPHYYQFKPEKLLSLDACLVKAPFSYGLENINWGSWDTNLERLGSDPSIPLPEDFLSWADWVDAMLPLFKEKWMLNGIYQAIMLSKHHITLNPSLIGTALCFWDSTSNSFAFGPGPMTPPILDMAALFGFRPHDLSIDALADFEMKNRKVRVPMRASASEIMRLKTREIEFMHLAEALHNESDLATGPFMLALLYHCLHRITVDPFNLNVCGPIWMLQIWLEWYFPELGSAGSESLEDDVQEGDVFAIVLATRPRWFISTEECFIFFRECRQRPKAIWLRSLLGSMFWFAKRGLHEAHRHWRHLLDFRS